MIAAWQGEDRSLQSYFTEHFAQAQYLAARRGIESYTAGFDAAASDDVSLQWLAQTLRAEDEIAGDRPFRLAGGYGALIDWLHESRKTCQGCIFNPGAFTHYSYALRAAVAGGIYAIIISSKAHQFATSGSQTYVEAHQLTSSGGLIGLQLAGLLGALLVALSLVLVSVQAMRVGLLTRFMGYLGMFAGALVLFQITPLPVVETYWFVALAVLFAGRWPTGVPLARKAGRAEKWPTVQELRGTPIRAAGGGTVAGSPGASRL